MKPIGITFVVKEDERDVGITDSLLTARLLVMENEGLKAEKVRQDPAYHWAYFNPRGERNTGDSPEAGSYVLLYREEEPCSTRVTVAPKY